MFTEEELKEYEGQLKQLGITEDKKQEEVLEYFYQLGKIIYNFNISSHEEEN